MPRSPRVQVAGGIYHVNTKATDGDVVFGDDADRARFLQLLASVLRTYRWDCLSYCVLGNHYHLAFRIEEANLARGMQYLNARHAEGFNHRYGRRGHAFGARYHSELVETASHALEVSRYIPLNPVRAGLCASPEDWQWSSFAATIGVEEGPPWLKPDWILGLFATDLTRARRRYRAFVLSALAPEPSTSLDGV